MNEITTGMDRGGFGKLRIGVFPAFEGAGASFICGSLAYLAAEGLYGRQGAAQPARKSHVSLAELGSPYFYRALSFEKREGLYPFCSVRRLLEEKKSLQGAENMKDGINWLIKEPKDSEPYEGGKLFRLISSAPGSICFFDCSGITSRGRTPSCGIQSVGDIAAEMDRVIFVIDPMPTRLLEASSSISEFLLEFPEAMVIINKSNSGVREKELRRFLGRKAYYAVGHMPPELMYKAEYASKLPASIAQSNEIIVQMNGIVSNLL